MMLLNRPHEKLKIQHFLWPPKLKLITLSHLYGFFLSIHGLYKENIEIQGYEVITFQDIGLQKC